MLNVLACPLPNSVQHSSNASHPSAVTAQCVYEVVIGQSRFEVERWVRVC